MEREAHQKEHEFCSMIHLLMLHECYIKLACNCAIYMTLWELIIAFWLCAQLQGTKKRVACEASWGQGPAKPNRGWIRVGGSQTWLLQAWLFAIFTQKRSSALFCALLRSFADFSFAVICALLPTFAYSATDRV